MSAMLGVLPIFDAALLSNDMQRVDDVRRRACEYLGDDEPKAP